MRAKWYFGALIVLISFLGIYQNRTSEPNQEIVLQFTDVSVTSDEAQNAINEVVSKLQDLGVNTFQVKETPEGKVLISYYSATDVASIKNQLSDDSELQLGFKNPSSQKLPNKNNTNYKFDVFEINKTLDSSSGFGGKHMVTVKQDFDRFFNPNVYIFNSVVGDNHEALISEVALKVFKTIAITIDSSVGNIPEVRAGPKTSGMA
ncbi:hypothetical protein [Aestuariibaculum sediminum]|uniref:Uncharacterized protein n=1 Tax=Aestuariibaculum sediminum TaxID=2770637 RepID=A0A8J6Q2K4_9FLAO|nr:hypothetical protein [Aestuariibaculum sediminum]MBD0832256.1 hypothetical protein [Aestuariibaculum sediminum]